MNIKSLHKWLPDLRGPLVIAGPCSAETREQVRETAKELKKNEEVRIFRAGLWKPRTRPHSFEGVGEEGLSWLKEVKEETGLLVTTEVANGSHVEMALKADIDILWLGARTVANPFSVQEIANALQGTPLPVMVKNPINADLALWMGALERLNLAGIDKLVAIHRGFSTTEKNQYRNQPLWRIPIELKRLMPEISLLCDPSHITGRRDLIPLVCQKAMDMDMDGLMIETHLSPEKAWSDASQQVTPQFLKEVLQGLALKAEFSPDRAFEHDLEELRKQIDRIDSEIIESLRMRFNIVDRIGELKMKNKVTAFQVHRMDSMLNEIKNLAQKLALRPEFIEELYNLIHEESIKIQTEMMRSFLKEKPSSEKL